MVTSVPSAAFRTAATFGLLAALGHAAVAAATVPAEAIAAGTPRWVDSVPGDRLLDARIDVGTIRAVDGEEFEVDEEWPIGPGLVNDVRLREPRLVVPPGTVSHDRERVSCSAAGVLSFPVQSAWIAPDGRVVREKRYLMADERQRALASPYARAPYGPDPRSLVCMAVAAKCAGKAFAWPPAPNLTPLEDSPRATRMHAAYAAQFIPACRLAKGVGQ